MTRTILWLLAGLLMGLLIHLVVILTLPALAERDLWARLVALDSPGQFTVLEAPRPGGPNPMRLDPELAYGVCVIDLSKGPVLVTGFLPDAFWSAAVFRRDGTVLYSTTNRDGQRNLLQLGVFNVAQTRLLARQELDVEEGFIIVEADIDDLAIVVRLAPPHPQMQERYRERIAALTCGD